jgi:exodeoxyribonuclease VII small subunit
MAAEKFETVLKKLEDVVRRLEGGELSLTSSQGLLKKGQACCSARKSSMRQRVGGGAAQAERRDFR